MGEQWKTLLSLPSKRYSLVLDWGCCIIVQSSQVTERISWMHKRWPSCYGFSRMSWTSSTFMTLRALGQPRCGGDQQSHCAIVGGIDWNPCIHRFIWRCWQQAHRERSADVDSISSVEFPSNRDGSLLPPVVASVQDWVACVTTLLLNMKLQQQQQEQQQEQQQQQQQQHQQLRVGGSEQQQEEAGRRSWLNLLPKNSMKILPTHWDKETLESRCKAVMMAVNSA